MALLIWQLSKNSQCNALLGLLAGHRQPMERLACASQVSAQFFSRPKERVLCRLFGSVQHFADRAETQTLKVFELEDHTLPRRQLVERRANLAVQHLALQLPIGIRAG